MSRNLVATIVLFAAVTAGCGGGGDSLGNAQPWCPLADDFITSVEELSKLYRDDAKLSSIEEADDEWDDAREDLYYNAEASDFTSGRALEGLYDEGNGLVEASRSDDDEYYEDARDDFEDAKELIHRICAS